jgi:hypothetical protein
MNIRDWVSRKLIAWGLRLRGPQASLLTEENCNEWLSPPGDGWLHWHYTAPPKGSRVVELWRSEWRHETRFARVDQIHGAMNIYGLWWRYA